MGLSHPVDMVYHIQPWMALSLLPLVAAFEGERAMSSPALFGSVDDVGVGKGVGERDERVGVVVVGALSTAARRHLLRGPGDEFACGFGSVDVGSVGVWWRIGGRGAW